MSDIDFNSTEQKGSYGLGFQMGQQARSAFEGVSLEHVTAGLIDAFQGNDLQVDGDALNSALIEIQKKQQAAQQRDAEQLGAAGVEFLQVNASREGVVTTETGLQYEVLASGNGAQASASSTVRTHYRGCLIDGTEFDSSYQRGEPADFPVNGVIQGWQQALPMMREGDKWKLFIPHQLAYGERGAGQDIPPYQALVFEIELIAVLS